MRFSLVRCCVICGIFNRGQTASLLEQIRHVTGGFIHHSGPKPPVTGYLIDASASCVIPRHPDCGKKRRMPREPAASAVFPQRAEREGLPMAMRECAARNFSDVATSDRRVRTQCCAGVLVLGEKSLSRECFT